MKSKGSWLDISSRFWDERGVDGWRIGIQMVSAWREGIIERGNLWIERPYLLVWQGRHQGQNRMLPRRLGGSKACIRRRLGHRSRLWYLILDSECVNYIPYVIGAAAQIGSVTESLQQHIVCLCVSLWPRSHWGPRKEQRDHWNYFLCPCPFMCVWRSLGLQEKSLWQSGVSSREARWSIISGCRCLTSRE